MPSFDRVGLRDIPWLPVAAALALTGFGMAFVISATSDPEAPLGIGREARMQALWWLVGLGTGGLAAWVNPGFWRNAAVPLYLACICAACGMLLLAGSALVPTIKGAHNWLAFGSMRLQPSEFYKLGCLLCLSVMLTAKEVDIRRPAWLAATLIVAGVIPVLLVREDLGSALTFGPMILGLLFLAGARLRHLGALVGLGMAGIVVGIATLSRTGYQWKRIQAWLDPESYALSEGYQTIRSVRALGSGQVDGKGYGLGDQNLLGWVPEKHTDMIFAVVGEEMGFFGTVLVVLLFLAFGWACLWTSIRCHDPFGKLAIGGFACLILGQACINLSVVTGLMPVTGVTLPFLSYGGSSLLATYLGLGVCVSLARGQPGEGRRVL